MIAKVLALLVNIHSKPGSREFVANDFMPDYLGVPEPPQTAEQQYAALSYITGITGGKVFDDDATDEEMEAYVLQGVDLSTFGEPYDFSPESDFFGEDAP